MKLIVSSLALLGCTSYSGRPVHKATLNELSGTGAVPADPNAPPVLVVQPGKYTISYAPKDMETDTMALVEAADLIVGCDLRFNHHHDTVASKHFGRVNYDVTDEVCPFAPDGYNLDQDWTNIENLNFYVENLHEPGSRECLVQKTDPTTGKPTGLDGVRYDNGEYWGRVRYLLVEETPCSNQPIPGTYSIEYGDDKGRAWKKRNYELTVGCDLKFTTLDDDTFGFKNSAEVSAHCIGDSVGKRPTATTHTQEDVDATDPAKFTMFVNGLNHPHNRDCLYKTKNADGKDILYGAHFFEQGAKNDRSVQFYARTRLTLQSTKVCKAWGQSADERSVAEGLDVVLGSGAAS